MIIFLGLIFIVALWGLRKTDIAEYDYMSKRMTNSIKGIFICLVFLSHISKCADFSHPILDRPYRIFQGVTGQCIVTLFLFYSGFGIMESVKKGGVAYIRKLPIQRLLKTLLLFDSAVLIFLILLGGGGKYNCSGLASFYRMD